MIALYILGAYLLGASYFNAYETKRVIWFALGIAALILAEVMRYIQ